MTVVGAAGGVTLKGAVPVDSTDEAGGAAGGAYVPGGVGAGLTGTVAHSLRVTVTVTGAPQAARRHVSLRYMIEIGCELTVGSGDNAGKRRNCSNCKELEAEHDDGVKWIECGDGVELG